MPMTRSEMVDCGIDFDYAETINSGDEYLWNEEDEEDYEDEDEDYDCDRDDLEMGFDPFEGCYTYDC